MLLTHDQLRTVVEDFYRRVRADPELAPIFASHVPDWDAHMARLADFWSSLMLTSGRYKGNPFATHQPFAFKLDEALFDRWLALWREATSEAFPQDVAAQMQLKAQKVAKSLKAGLLDGPTREPRPTVESTA